MGWRFYTDQGIWLNIASMVGQIPEANIVLTGYVPNTRKVNGHALSVDVTVSKSDVGLGAVENTALSTWAGSSNVTTIGTITGGTWQATAIADTYIASAATWNAKQSALSFTTGLTNTVGTVTVNTSQNIATLSNLTSNGFVTTSGGNGTLGTDTNTYLTTSSASSTYVAKTVTVNGHALSANVTVTNADLGAVPTTTTVNGHALSSNVTVTKSDLGLGNVENTALSTWAGTTNITSINATQSISTLSNLTTNGFVKTGSGTGALSIDTSTYLTGNQAVTLTGNVTGSGATSIATTIAAGAVTNAMLAGSIDLTAKVTGVLRLVNGGNGFVGSTPVWLTGKSATTSSVASYTPGSDGSFEVAMWGSISAISSGTLTLTCTYTDEAGTSRTKTFFPMGNTTAGITTTAAIHLPASQIRAKASNAITLVATFSGTSITYSIGGYIRQLA